MLLTSSPRSLAFITAAALVLSACKKEEVVDPTTTLPEATQTGQNTAGAKVNGTVWRSVQDAMWAGPAISAHYLKNVTGYSLSLYFERFAVGGNPPYNETNITLYVPNVRTLGTVVLDQTADPRLTTANPAYATFSYQKTTPSQLLITGPAYPGTLTVTRLDTVARIISGTYEFQAKEKGGPATISVTDGRFDVKY